MLVENAWSNCCKSFLDMHHLIVAMFIIVHDKNMRVAGYKGVRQHFDLNVVSKKRITLFGSLIVCRPHSFVPCNEKKVLSCTWIICLDVYTHGPFSKTRELKWFLSPAFDLFAPKKIKSLFITKGRLGMHAVTYLFNALVKKSSSCLVTELNINNFVDFNMFDLMEACKCWK